MSDKKIFWLASFPKSGSTWLRLLLEHYFTGELPFEGHGKVVRGDNSKEFYDRVSAWSLTGSCEHIPNYIFLRYAALAMMCSHWQVDKEVLTRHILLKSHNSNVKLYETEAFPLFLSSGALVITRDPRDVAISYAKYVGKDQQWGVDSICNGVVMEDKGKPPTPLGGWDAWHMSWATEQRFPVSVVRYEDMQTDTKGILKMVLGAIGEKDIDDKKVSAAVDACEFKKLQKMESEKGFGDHMGKGQFFRKGKSGGWKDKLTLKQIAQINESCGKMMNHLGYS